MSTGHKWEYWLEPGKKVEQLASCSLLEEPRQAVAELAWRSWKVEPGNPANTDSG